MKYTLLELIHCLALGMLFIGSLRRIDLIEKAEAAKDFPQIFIQGGLLILALFGIWFLSRNLYEIHEARIVQKMWDEDNEK